MATGSVNFVWLPSIVLGLLGACTAAAQGTKSPDGRELVRTHCVACHAVTAGGFDRISAVRKTPEGWSMTIFRMQNVHGLQMPDDALEPVIRYLSDTQGLAPSEAAPGRFALERRPNVSDLDLGGDLAPMCGRCHTLARVSLQRRNADEWLKLVNFHVGQFTTLEYQAGARDRPWWDIATKETTVQLGKLLPLDTPAWTAWRQATHRAPTGRWIVTGHEPGGRDLYGTADIVDDGQGGFRATYRLRDTKDTVLSGESHAFVYTGYEWRGRGLLAGRESREVFAVSEDGMRLTGRWFDPGHAEEGGDWTAVRADATPQVIAVLPRSMKAGSSGPVVVVATGLGTKPKLDLGPGVAVSGVANDEASLRATVTVAADAATGARTVTAGNVSTPGAFAVYRTIDKVEVRPSFAIARVGGGRIAPVTAQFEAYASATDAAGNAVPLGPVTALWKALPYDAEAARTRDEVFGGVLEANGRYRPAGGGPNPERQFSGNNTANLKIQATVSDGAEPRVADSHLIVTVQRWVNPPIY